MITGRQVRAARGLLRWRVEDLAQASDLTREAISRIEDESVQPRATSLNKIRIAFERNGVEFLDHDGVRRKPEGIEVFEGADRFDDFYEFFYQHLKERGGEVCLSITDENLLRKYRKDSEIHRSRMQALYDAGRITMRVLATEARPSSSYATLRYQPPQSTIAPTSFYAFGDCLALISFNAVLGPNVVVVKSAALAESYRMAFNMAWERSNDAANH